MRSMSFMLTTEQVRNRSKTVTRRTGWANLKPGTVLRAVVKGMGLKKGERMEPLAIIRVVSVERMPLSAMLGTESWGDLECEREGFPHLTPHEFVRMFVESHADCGSDDEVTRIEFGYVPGGRLENA